MQYLVCLSLHSFFVISRVAAKLAGDEAVALYVSHQIQKASAPLRALKGFRRVNLKPGKSKVIQFSLSPNQLSPVDAAGTLYQPKDKIMISVGGGQPGIKHNASGNVVTGILGVD